MKGREGKAYIIAEIGSNFDGSISRAERLIECACDAGADAVKFQCFTTDSIISKEGFEGLRRGFQAEWGGSVYETYKHAELPQEWLEELFHYASEKGLQFLGTPYDKKAADILDNLGVPAFKIGSGDITWHELLRYIAKKGKGIILSTGASTIGEVDKALKAIQSERNYDITLLQCITNYPARFEDANIRAMKAMGDLFNVPVGYSDHTQGIVVALGAVALGASVIEKHLTDDKTRIGPDHPFAMETKEFKSMVDNIRILENALGSPTKDLYGDERETVLLQRRCLRASEAIRRDTKVTRDMIAVLRPMAEGGLEPEYEETIIGRKLKRSIKKGDPFTWAVI